MLIQKSCRQKEFRFLTSQLKGIRSSDWNRFSPDRSLQKPMKGGFNGTSFGKIISSEISYEQLEGHVVTGIPESSGLRKMVEETGWTSQFK